MNFNLKIWVETRVEGDTAVPNGTRDSEALPAETRSFAPGGCRPSTRRYLSKRPSGCNGNRLSYSDGLLCECSESQQTTNIQMKG